MMGGVHGHFARITAEASADNASLHLNVQVFKNIQRFVTNLVAPYYDPADAALTVRTMARVLTAPPTLFRKIKRNADLFR